MASSVRRYHQPPVPLEQLQPPLTHRQVHHRSRVSWCRSSRKKPSDKGRPWIRTPLFSSSSFYVSYIPKPAIPATRKNKPPKAKTSREKKRKSKKADTKEAEKVREVHPSALAKSSKRGKYRNLAVQSKPIVKKLPCSVAAAQPSAQRKVQRFRREGAVRDLLVAFVSFSCVYL